MRRNDPRMLVLTTYRAMVVYVPFMLIQGSVGAALPGWAAFLWMMLVVYYSVTRLEVIFTKYLTTFWHADGAGIRFRTGWPVREETHLSWAEVGSLEVHQGWLARLLCVSQVTASVGAENRRSLVLDALSRAETERLLSLHDVSPAGDEEGGCVAIEESGEEIYRARPRDYFLIGFTHGKFFLFVPFLLGTGSDLLEYVGVDLFGLQVTWELVIVAVVAAGAYGVVRALVTYGRYRVIRVPSGFKTKGGIVQRTTFEARATEVVGIRIDRNPLMQLTGYCSVNLILATGRRDLEALPILPVIAYGRAFDEVKNLIPVHCEQRSPWAGKLPFTVLAGGVGVAVVFAWASNLWLAGLALAGALSAANSLVARVGRGDGVVLVERGLLGRSLRVIDEQMVRSVSAFQRVWPTPSSTVLMSFTVLDRRKLKLHIPGVPVTLARMLMAVPRSVPVAGQRCRRLGYDGDRFP
jgi:membrane protein